MEQGQITPTRPGADSALDRSRNGQQVKLTVFDNEPLAYLAQQRLQEEAIPCMVRPLGAGPGGWGVATNLPHAIYVRAADEMKAREVLDLPPSEIAEREGRSPQSTGSTQQPSLLVVTFLIITVAALLFGIVELLVRQILF